MARGRGRPPKARVACIGDSEASSQENFVDSGTSLDNLGTPAGFLETQVKPTSSTINALIDQALHNSCSPRVSPPSSVQNSLINQGSAPNLLVNSAVSGLNSAIGNGPVLDNVTVSELENNDVIVPVLVKSSVKDPILVDEVAKERVSSGVPLAGLQCKEIGGTSVSSEAPTVSGNVQNGASVRTVMHSGPPVLGHVQDHQNEATPKANRSPRITSVGVISGSPGRGGISDSLLVCPIAQEKGAGKQGHLVQTSSFSSEGGGRLLESPVKHCEPLGRSSPLQIDNPTLVIWVQGTPMFSLFAKLKVARNALSSFHKANFSNITIRAKEAKEALLSCQDELQNSPLSSSIIHTEQQLLQKFKSLKKAELSALMQRAKIQEVKQGDCSTSYFYAKIKERKAKQNIGDIVDHHGIHHHGLDNVASAFVHYYQELLAASQALMARGRGRPPKIQPPIGSTVSFASIDTSFVSNDTSSPKTHSPSTSSITLNDLIVDVFNGSSTSKTPLKSSLKFVVQLVNSPNTNKVISKSPVNIPINVNGSFHGPDSTTINGGKDMNGNVPVNSQVHVLAEFEVVMHSTSRSWIPPVGTHTISQKAVMHSECCKKDGVQQAQTALKRALSPKSSQPLTISNRFANMSDDSSTDKDTLNEILYDNSPQENVDPISTMNTGTKVSCLLGDTSGGVDAIQVIPEKLHHPVKHPECFKEDQTEATQIALKRGHPNYLSLVKEAWMEPDQEAQIYKLFAKMKNVKLKLKDLHKSHYSNLSLRIDTCLAELYSCQEKIQQNRYTQDLYDQEKDLLNSYTRLRKTEGTMLKQRAKIEHISYNDSSSKYFFARLHERKQQQIIGHIIDKDGNNLIGVDNVAKGFIDYYKGLLAEAEADERSESIQNLISRRMNEYVNRRVRNPPPSTRRPRRNIERNREEVEALSASDRVFQQRHGGNGRPSFSPLQRCTSAIRVLAYGTSTDSVDEYLRMSDTSIRDSLKSFVEGVIQNFGTVYLRRPNPDDLARLLHMGQVRGFPGMLGSIDCMHWEWKNCPTALAGQYGGRSGKPTIVLEAVASYDLWIWHAFFGTPGSLNDINVLQRSPLFNEWLEEFAPAVNFTVNGEKKLGKVIVPDKWKDGASNTNESGGRKINENKLLSKKNRWTPYGTVKCIICKQQVHQNGKYCHTCAYSKGFMEKGWLGWQGLGPVVAVGSSSGRVRGVKGGRRRWPEEVVRNVWACLRRPEEQCTVVGHQCGGFGRLRRSREGGGGW
ncbi:hypothetical protein KSS87_008911, partial [Heliosperma pusillum]